MQLAEAPAVAELSVEEVLATIMMIKVIESMAPGIFLRTVTEGALARWLNRIAELTEPKKTAGGRNTAAMWEKLHQIVDAIPRGRWVSYGDLAKAIKSGAQPVGSYLAANPVEKAYRVLRADGTVSEGFSWLDENDKRSPRELLEHEGIRFDDAGRAASAQRWEINAESINEF